MAGRRSKSNERIAISAIHLAFGLSLLMHAALLSGWLPKIDLRPSEKLGEGKPAGSLAVRLAPPPSPPPAPASAPASAASPPMQAAPAPARPAAAPRPAPAERVLALERPSSAKVEPRPEPPKAAAPAPADFASYVESRRSARESVPSSSGPPLESAQERDNRIAAMNLGLNRTPTFGDEQKHGGGIFQVARVGFNDAEFFFFGWNKAIRRNSRQMIEVRRGDNPSTELAVVRRMIAIIREHESGDFIWESNRLRRDVWLSARMSDNGGLEQFLMHEFFPDARRR